MTGRSTNVRVAHEPQAKYNEDPSAEPVGFFLFSCGTIHIVLSEKSKNYIVFGGNSLQKKLINFLHNVTEMC